MLAFMQTTEDSPATGAVETGSDFQEPVTVTTVQYVSKVLPRQKPPVLSEDY